MQVSDVFSPGQTSIIFVLYVFFGTLQLVGYGVPGQSVGWFTKPVSLFAVCRSG